MHELTAPPDRSLALREPVERPLPLGERLAAIGALRKGLILALLAALWQAYAVWLDNPLIFPTFSETLRVLITDTASGTLLLRAAFSLKVLLTGYVIGVVLAGLFTALAIRTRPGQDLLETLTAMFNPLPAIALLPLALMWFGLGNGSLIFVLVHSVLWPVALNIHSGFKAVSPTLRMVGRNYDLRGLGFVAKILIPAAFPCILSGLKIGWAFAWRTLIAAELVFGISSGSGGLGWYIYENKNRLEISSVFAGLLMVILIGLLVENLVFRTIEARTLRRWGMHA
ncbi:ABC transporter permease [uncultured Thiodictyon sp.]|uniref:ABC transporter permease n=1 Tax=uncultured Thiodictyon sp. TaxID=1846217 RepID=UPI0025D18C4A|nr:ABC transporter permease [uncultured Thiodictyon sp.]